MNGDQIIKKVKELNLPEGSYIVFGSCPMAVAGIRQSGDIDFLVSHELFMQLGTSGWAQIEKTPANRPLIKDDFEVHENWTAGSYDAVLEDLLKTADIIDDVPFASLNEVVIWKTASNRTKDQVDIKLIKEHLGQA